MSNRQLNQSVFEHFPALETKRLNLRELHLDDAAIIFEMRANKRIGQFIALRR